MPDRGLIRRYLHRNDEYIGKADAKGHMKRSSAVSISQKAVRAVAQPTTTSNVADGVAGCVAVFRLESLRQPYDSWRAQNPEPMPKLYSIKQPLTSTGKSIRTLACAADFEP